MSTAVIVVSNHRTGSGCLASVLHTLGVSMLPTELPTLNGDDRWEDQDFVALHRRIFREQIGRGHSPSSWRYPMPQFTPAIIKDYVKTLTGKTSRLLWGFKDPRAVFVLDFIMGLTAGLGIGTYCVWLRRDLAAVAASLKKRDDKQWPTDHEAVARHQYAQWQSMYSRYSYAVPGIAIKYEDLVGDPETTVTSLAQQLPIKPTPEQIEAAITLVWKGHGT